MEQTTESTLPQELEAARGSFEEWRRTRPRAGPIPQPLWELAVKLAATHGNYRTARALRLDSTKLARVAQGAAGPTRTRTRRAPTRAAGTTQPSFVELPRWGADAAPECLLELEGRSGARLRIQLRGAALEELAAFAREIYRSER